MLLCSEILKRTKFSNSHNNDTPDWRLISYISYIYIIHVCMFVHAKGPRKWPCKADQAIFSASSTNVQKKDELNENPNRQRMKFFGGLSESAKKTVLKFKLYDRFRYLF